MDKLRIDRGGPNAEQGPGSKVVHVSIIIRGGGSLDAAAAAIDSIISFSKKNQEIRFSSSLLNYIQWVGFKEDPPMGQTY